MTGDLPAHVQHGTLVYSDPAHDIWWFEGQVWLDDPMAGDFEMTEDVVYASSIMALLVKALAEQGICVKHDWDSLGSELTPQGEKR